jgi:hypothetical protein
VLENLHAPVSFLLASAVITFGAVTSASASCNPTPFTPNQAFAHTYASFPGLKFDIQPSTPALTTDASGQIQLGTAKILIEFDGTRNSWQLGLISSAQNTVDVTYTTDPRLGAPLPITISGLTLLPIFYSTNSVVVINGPKDVFLTGLCQ